MTLREFLRSTIAASVRAAVGRAEAAGAAPLPMIDPHSIFTIRRAGRGGGPWPPRTDEILYRPRLPADLKMHEGEVNVVVTVVVEASERAGW